MIHIFYLHLIINSFLTGIYYESEKPNTNREVSSIIIIGIFLGLEILLLDFLIGLLKKLYNIIDVYFMLHFLIMFYFTDTFKNYDKDLFKEKEGLAKDYYNTNSIPHRNFRKGLEMIRKLNNF